MDSATYDLSLLFYKITILYSYFQMFCKVFFKWSNLTTLNCSPWWNRTTILRIKIWCNQPLYQEGEYFNHDVKEQKTLNFFGSGSHIKIITLYLLRHSIWTIQVYRPTITKLRLHWLTNMVNWVFHCFICISITKLLKSLVRNGFFFKFANWYNLLNPFVIT